MALQIFPEPIAESDNSTLTNFVPLPDHLYHVVTQTFSIGSYELKMTAASKTAKVEFFDANSTLITTVNLSGTTVVVLNLATEATKIRCYQPYVQSTVSTVTVQIEFKGGTLLTNTFSGTVQTVTTTQAVSINGTAYVIAIGGGGGGNVGRSYPQIGTGGGTGGVGEILKTNWSGSYTVTIGAGGSGCVSGDAFEEHSGKFGGATSISGGGFTMTANGGGSGHKNYNHNTGYPGSVTGTKDFSGGAYGGWVHGNAGEPYAFIYQHAKGGGVHSGAMGGISTGQTNILNGRGGYGVEDGTQHATGFGNSGGGITYSTGSHVGGNGAPGVVYIITNITEI